MIDKYNEVGISALEHTSIATAKPAEECMFPECGKCDKYHGHYCTVPMVISKQIWRMTEEKLWYLNKMVDRLENLVYDEILGSKE